MVDLYEVPTHVRPLWLSVFMQALVDAPKKLWRELLVYVDEAHVFAPEPGHGAVDSEVHRRCRLSMVEFASRGRKRGFGIVAATQRLGKLSKDFAAELKNAMVGQTFMDVDRERAAACLGIARAGKEDFFQEVKHLAPGRFFAIGRALATTPTLVTVGGVETEHPVAGKRQSSPPPPTNKILHLLPQLADLPKEAAEEAKTLKELRARVAELERKLTESESRRPAPPPLVRAAWPELNELVGSARGACVEMVDVVTTILDNLDVVDNLKEAAEKVKQSQLRLQEHLAKVPSRVDSRAMERISAYGKLGPGGVTKDETRPKPPSSDGLEDDPVPGGGLRRILVALAQRSRGLTDAQLGVRALLSSKSGTFSNYLSQARRRGWIVDQGGGVRVLTRRGHAALGDYEMLPEGPALLAYWVNKLGTGGVSRMLSALGRAYPESLTHERLAEEAGMESSTSGTFSNYVSLLCKLELAQRAGKKELAMSGELVGG